MQALLKKANLQILEQHMHHCVTDAFENGSKEDRNIKIEEIITILDKYYK